MPRDDIFPARRRAPTVLVLVLVLVLASLVLVLVLAGGASLWLWRPTASEPFYAPGLSAPVDAAGLEGQGYGVTMSVLGTVYAAFAQTEEAAIYDGLAEVAAGDALEALYLERACALATGGLPD